MYFYQLDSHIFSIGKEKKRNCHLFDQNTIQLKIENICVRKERKNFHTEASKFSRVLYHSSIAGTSGAGAMYVNIFSLMWLYTTIAYQNVKGCSSYEAIQRLYSQGGIRRFYKGLIPAMLIGPMCRFGDTFSNHVVLHTFDDCLYCCQDFSIAFKTLPASILSAMYRLCIFPIDTLMTINQVKGCSFHSGLRRIFKKLQVTGVKGIYDGAGVSFAGNILSHWTWFTTYNYLNSAFDAKPHLNSNKNMNDKYKQQCRCYSSELDFDEISVSSHRHRHFCLRNGIFGLFASITSDCLCNIFYVMKTNKQLNLKITSNSQVISKTGGWKRTIGRSLPLRIMGSGLQGFIFSISWSFFQSLWDE